MDKKNELFYKIGEISLQKIKLTFDDIIKNLPVCDYDNSLQIGIQYNKKIENEPNIPCGPARDIKNMGNAAREINYLNPYFQNTYFENIYNRYLSSYSRLRFMGLKHKSCYSVNLDNTKRVHIPVFTSPQNFFVFPEENECFHLKEGGIYIVDTRLPHTFFNGSHDIRWHIIGDVHKG